jgi:chemotaxis protein histidine kinase CheA
MSENKQSEARIFVVDTRFQQMARRPGGVPRTQAVERAQATLDELKQDFSDWLDRQLQDLGVAIQQLENAPFDISRLDEAYRSCCQLRDVGTTMGFELITVISGNLCEIIDAVRAGTPYEKETIDCHLDALVLTSKPPYCDLRPDQLPEMTSGLRQIVERCSIVPSK